MDAKKKTLLAFGLGFLWVGLAVWQWGAVKEPIRVPLTNATGAASASQLHKAKASGLRVNLELLASARTQREATFTAPRNIFAVPSPDGTLPIGNEIVQESEPNPASEQVLRQQTAVAELAQYRYLGFLRMGERRKKNKNIAVLSKNEEVVVVKVGDHLAEYVVLKVITPESVTIRDTGARVEHTVSLSEEAPAQQ